MVYNANGTENNTLVKALVYYLVALVIILPPDKKHCGDQLHFLRSAGLLFVSAGYRV